MAIRESFTVHFHAEEDTEIKIEWLKVDTRKVATLRFGGYLTVFLGSDEPDGIVSATKLRDAIDAFLDREGVEVE
jgi:hypothetical protein